MPIYAIRCDCCGAEQDIYRSVSQYDDLPECCGERMHRRVTAPHVMTDIQPYQSMIDGTWITSRSKHREHLKDHGCIEVGNETKHLKSKAEIDVSPESKARRKQTIIDKVNALK